jgi:pimeloyl-ACP methyl ester carboxylesterase
MSYIKLWIGLIGVALLAGCQSNPYKEWSGLDRSVIQSQGLPLLSLKNEMPPGSALHIYIEGDGQPWVGERIAADPGPFKLISLSLMQQDPNPSIYLGRPCYFQDLIGDKNCHPSLWTRARYSQQVVDVMVAALLSRPELADYDEWVLIGHSGGGTLAYLMAQQLPKVKQVIAISSNLNVGAWVDHHDYAPLDHSLDPTKIDSPKPLQLFYLAGGKDKNVPLKVNQTFLDQVNATIILREEYDHNCCWKKEWRKILDQI